MVHRRWISFAVSSADLLLPLLAQPRPRYCRMGNFTRPCCRMTPTPPAPPRAVVPHHPPVIAPAIVIPFAPSVAAAAIVLDFQTASPFCEALHSVQLRI